MVGKALNVKQMTQVRPSPSLVPVRDPGLTKRALVEQILRNMSSMDQPWVRLSSLSHRLVSPRPSH